MCMDFFWTSVIYFIVCYEELIIYCQFQNRQLKAKSVCKGRTASARLGLKIISIDEQAP